MNDLLFETNSLLEDSVGVGFKGERKPYQQALEFADQMKGYLGELGVPPEEVYYAGSLRRLKPTVGDLDIIVVTPVGTGTLLYRKFVDLLHAKGHDVAVKQLGDSHLSVRIDDFLVEFKRAEKEHLGAMLLFATGPGDYNMGMRAYANHCGYHLSQYGLAPFDATKKKTRGDYSSGATEEGIYRVLGIPYELPQDRGVFKTPSPVEGGEDKSRSFFIPQELWERIPDEVKEQLKDFKLPDKDENGIKIPKDFLLSKVARQNYYKLRGKFKIPDTLKLDRYK